MIRSGSQIIRMFNMFSDVTQNLDVRPLYILTLTFSVFSANVPVFVKSVQTHNVTLMDSSTRKRVVFTSHQ